ncbi:MAG: hypothetical protein AB7N76_04775 [Planctomycetota bacterium]
MIRFACTCGTPITVPAALAGEEGRCPSCQRTLRAPAPPELAPYRPSAAASAPSEELVQLIHVARDHRANRARRMLAFDCGGCGAPLRINVALAGKPGRCAQCGHLLTIPHAPGEAPAARGAAPAQAEPEPAPPPPEPSARPEPPLAARPAAPGPAAPGPAATSTPPLASLGPGSARLGARVGVSSPDAPTSARDAFRVVPVQCECGRRVKAPLERVRAGQARCPSCDRALTA